jgi:hypothetical protein
MEELKNSVAGKRFRTTVTANAIGRGFRNVYWLKCQEKFNSVTLSVADNSISTAANDCKIVADNLHLCG